MLRRNDDESSYPLHDSETPQNSNFKTHNTDECYESLID